MRKIKTYPKQTPHSHGMLKRSRPKIAIMATSATVGIKVKRKIINHNFLKALAFKPNPAKSIIFIKAISLNKRKKAFQVKEQNFAKKNAQ